MFGFVDHAHAALAKLTQDAVSISEHAAEHWIYGGVGLHVRLHELLPA
jgi:hypothetical protein